jgi:4-hydroxybenzoate polyprenyltransferase
MSATIPLCIALDGALTPVDTLHEQLLALLRDAPSSLLAVPRWRLQGRSVLAHQLDARVGASMEALPLRDELVEWLNQQRLAGRRLVLVSTAGPQLVAGIARHVGLFDEIVFAEPNGKLTEERTRQALVERYGEKGFDYAGSQPRDTIVWQSARHAIVVGSDSVAACARQVADIERVFPATHARLSVWLRAMRMHQWVKNTLVFLPALLAHRITQPVVLLHALLSFAAFGCCASSVYLFNDLLDLSSDRQHLRKRRRPFAAGTLSARRGLQASLLLLCCAAALAMLTGPLFALVLAGYLALTWLYTLRFKRTVLLDVMLLAGLYTVRIIAGAAATRIEPSFWLLAFSVFMFLSLGFVKRYTELRDAVQTGVLAQGRGYAESDLPLLLNLGTASGYCTVVVMALYINSPDSEALYHHHKPLWLICPLLLYWISRIWLLATRGRMHDDPVVFALRDRVSLLVLALLAAVVLVSI